MISAPKRTLLAVFALVSAGSAAAQSTDSSALPAATPAPTETLDAIVVESELSKQGTPLIHAPGNVLKKDRAVLKEKAAQNLGAALSNEANVQFTGGPRGSGQLPQIRGLGSERILILDEGVRQNFQSTHSGRAFADFSLIESVEVVKGPWSSLYGSGAMGGVITFRRATAADYFKRTKKDQGAEIALDAASASSQLGERATAFGKYGLIEPLVSFHHLEAKDLRLGEGQTLPYSATSSKDLYTSLGFKLAEKHTFTLKGNRYFESTRQPLNPSTATSNVTEIGDTEIEKHDVVGDYRITKGEFLDLHAKPYFRHTQVAKSRLSDNRLDMQIVETFGIDAWNNWSLGRNQALTTTLTTGLEFFRDRTDGKRGAANLGNFPDGTGEQIGVYLQPTLVWNEKITVTPGIRYDSHRSSADSVTAGDNSGREVSLKFYTEYAMAPEKSVFAGWGQAFNAPRIQDLYVSGLHFPGGGPIPNNFFIANPDLKPERAETFEVGTKNRFHMSESIGTIGLNATAFLTQARDFINREVDINGGTTRFANVDRVKLTGAEITALWQKGIVGASLSYGQVRSENLNSGAPLADTPADHWLAKIETYPTETLTAGTEMRFAERQDRVPTGVESTGSYFVEDFYASYSLKQAEVTVRLNNAFDRSYRKHGSTLNEVGRDVRLTASWLF